MKPTRPVRSCRRQHAAQILSFPISLGFTHSFHLSPPSCLSFHSAAPPLLSPSGQSLPPSSSPCLYFCPRLCICLCFYCGCSDSRSPPPNILSLAGSVFSADEPLVGSGLARRQTEVTLRWRMAALLPVTQSYSAELSCEGKTEGRKQELTKELTKSNVVRMAATIHLSSLGFLLGYRYS